MSKLVFQKSRSLLNRGEVKLISANAGNLVFQVKDYEVYKTARGKWSCNAAVKGKDGVKKGCVIFGNRGIDCSHISACKLFLEGYDLEKH